jgi:hypothetical protein
VTKENPYELAARAAEKLAGLTGVESHDVALGSAGRCMHGGKRNRVSRTVLSE